MIASILFAVIFLCGLLNSYSPKFMAWLLSFLPAKQNAIAASASKKTDDDGDRRVVFDNKADQLVQVFATFDKDGDGFITTEELDESLKRLGLSCSDKEVVALIEKVDKNRDGLIDVEEFRDLYDSVVSHGDTTTTEGGSEGDQEIEDEMDLQEVFDVFDGNKDGVISFEELSSVLRMLGLKQGLKEEDCREMINKVDLDGDGTVNFDEFKQMMKAKLF